MPKRYLLESSTLVVMNKLRNTEQIAKFGERLRMLRTSKSLTLEALAFAADVEVSQIHRIEKGKINPTYTTLLALSAALEITISELVNLPK